VAVNDRYDGGHGNRHEEPGDAVQLNAGKDGNDDRQGMQVEAGADQTWIDDVILGHAECRKEAGDPQGQDESMERGDDRGDDRNHKRADERDEFQDAREDAEQER
jgi:hypothetical protein